MGNDNTSSSTRELIFNEAIQLMAERGYKNVTMRDIAKVVGIKASSIYNHYPGKDKILDRIYKYYDDHMFDGQLSNEKIMELMQTGTTDEIIKKLTFFWVDLQSAKTSKLMLITKIVYTCVFSDPKASELFLKWLETNTRFLKNALNYGVSIGRFKPFDTENYVFALISQYIVVNLLLFMQSSDITKSYHAGTINAWMEKILALLSNSAESSEI